MPLSALLVAGAVWLAALWSDLAAPLPSTPGLPLSERSLAYWYSAGERNGFLRAPVAQRPSFSRLVPSANGARLFAASNEGLWQSSNGGESWLRHPQVNGSLLALVAFGRDGVAALDADGRLWRSLDNGTSFTELTTPLGNPPPPRHAPCQPRHHRAAQLVAGRSGLCRAADQRT